MANGWIEGLTVASIILGTRARRPADRPRASPACCCTSTCRCIDTGIDTPAEAAIAVIVVVYAHRRALQPAHPATPASTLKPLPAQPAATLMRDFCALHRALWRDKLGQISLATTTLFWGAGATLQFIVHRLGRVGARLRPVARPRSCRAWSRSASRSARCSPRRCDARSTRSVRVIPLGIAMGVVVIAMNFVTSVWIAGRS